MGENETRHILSGLGVLCFLAILFWVGSALAQQDDWKTTVELGTDFPIAVGGQVRVVSPVGARLSLGAGVFPGPYLDAINEVVVPFTAETGYDEYDAKVVRDALENSAVIRLHVGYQFTEHFYAEVGYGWVGLGGSVNGSDALILATDFEPRGEMPQMENALEYAIDSTLHMVNAEVGWEWVDLDPWVFRTALGVAWTVAATTEVEPSFDVRFPQVRQRLEGLETWTEDYLDDLYTTTVISPTFSVGVGYRF